MGQMGDGRVIVDSRETGADGLMPPAAPRPERPGQAPLIGRERLLATLHEHLDRSRGGRLSVVLLGGAPGIGKSRLLDELAAAPHARDLTILRGGASQAAGMPPYLPFLTALGDYVATAPRARLQEEIGSHAAILATLLPEISLHLGPPPTPYPLPPEQARFRLYEAVAAFLGAIAAARPLLVLLDDLQWLDAATGDLLQHLAGRLQPARLLIAGAYRDDEANPAFARTVAELNRRRVLVTLPVAPLAEPAGRELAARLLGGEPAAGLERYLHRHSEGNPFFLEEIVLALADDGRLIERDGRWDLAELAAPLLPPRLAETIRLRLERLEPAMVDLLRTAAITGRTCDPGLLAAIAGLSGEQVEARLQTAARARLVRPEADGSYTFIHDLVRETLAADLSVAHRRRLHQATGEVLERRDDAGSTRNLADLAFHFAAAGDRDRGVTYALAAGGRALHASAASEAIDHYQTALDLLGPDGAPDRRAGAVIGLGDAATQAGDDRRAARAYTEANALWTQTGDAMAAARAAHKLGRAMWRQEAVPEARRAFEQALARLGPGDHPDAATTLLQLADLHATSLGRHTDGLAYAERALAMVERLGDRRLEAAACCVAGNVTARGGDMAAGRALLERALALAQALDDAVLAVEACAYLVNICSWTGDWDRSRELSLLRIDLARRTQDPFQLRHVYSWLASIEILRGQWDEAERLLAEQEPITAGLQSPEPRATVHTYRGLMRYYQGRFVEAEQEYRAAISLVRSTGSTAFTWFLGGLGLVLTELGRREEALDILTELRDIATASDEQSEFRLHAYSYLAVAYDRLGLRQDCATCYEQLLPFRGMFGPLPVNRALGIAARAGEDLTAAQRHLVEAEAQLRALGQPPELALTLLYQGIVERELGVVAGDGEPPQPDLIAEGLRLGTALGIQALCRQMLQPAPATPRQAGRDARVAGLSERELEVLRLVARGHTNREIAEALFLSEKTVARHLTTIYRKASVENRAGAAAFAHRSGLA